MSAIQYALSEVLNQIDMEVLRKAYLLNEPCKIGTLDNAILIKTLYGRVLPDINLIGGIEKNLCSDHGQMIDVDSYGVVYHFSDDYLHGHSIISPLAWFPGVTCSSGMTGISGGCACAGLPVVANIANVERSLESLAARLFQSTNIGGSAGWFKLRLVAHNSILIEGVQSMTTSEGTFKVMVSHDNALNDIMPKFWIPFSKLVVAAVKSYIYNTLRSSLMRGSLYNGSEYSIITDIISEYSDSEQMYQELRGTWGKMAMMNDRGRYAAYIARQTRPF